jgi:probable rRNA maturation factor
MRTKSRRATRPSRKRALRVAVQYACRAAGAPSAARLRSYVRAARPAAIDVTLRVVGAAEGRRLNRNYRGADRATNVLAFASGDIVLCHPIVVREARLQGKTLRAHYAHLVVHAMLHLRGYVHARLRDAKRMEKREIAILAGLGYADPYAAPIRA